MNTEKVVTVIDTLLGTASKLAPPSVRPWLELGRQVAGAGARLAAQGHVGAELRRRLADGIQRGDVISHDALEDASAATDAVDAYLDSLED